MDQLFRGDAIAQLCRLPSNSVDVIVTDPPYGDNAGYGQSNRTIASNEHPLVGLRALFECWRVARKNSSTYFFLGAAHVGFVRTFVEQYTPYRIKDLLVWDKRHIALGHGFRRRYELIFVLEKGKPAYRNRGLPNVLSFARIPTPEHPHKKPVELLSALIAHSSDPGDVVLDPFMGSGSTGVAAKRLSRRFIGIELSETYFRIAQERIAKESA